MVALEMTLSVRPPQYRNTVTEKGPASHARQETLSGTIYCSKNGLPYALGGRCNVFLQALKTLPQQPFCLTAMTNTNPVSKQGDRPNFLGPPCVRSTCTCSLASRPAWQEIDFITPYQRSHRRPARNGRSVVNHPSDLAPDVLPLRSDRSGRAPRSQNLIDSSPSSLSTASK